MNVVGKKVLVVDEVADTGASLKLVKLHVLEKGASAVKMATLYFKPRSVFKPDYFVKETNRWIVFPWELKETVGKIFEIHRGNAAAMQKKMAQLVCAGVPNRIVTRFLKDFNEAKPC